MSKIKWTGLESITQKSVLRWLWARNANTLESLIEISIAACEKKNTSNQWECAGFFFFSFSMEWIGNLVGCNLKSMKLATMSIQFFFFEVKEDEAANNAISLTSAVQNLIRWVFLVLILHFLLFSLLIHFHSLTD